MARKRVKNTVCPNCDFRFAETNNYCPHCGQENHTHKLPLKHFFVELLESIFHFDTKVFSTLRDLLLKPGEITLNFNQNKRNRYVPPLRLYIFVSFIFFLLLAVIQPKDETQSEGQSKPHQSTNSIQFDISDGSLTKDTSGQYQFEALKAAKEIETSQIDSYLIASKHHLTWYNKNLYRGLVKLNTGHVSEEELWHKFHKNTSTSMFFLMPLFAVFLLMFYRSQKLFYTEHLIFSIHFHTLAFLLLSIMRLFNWIGFDIDFWLFLAIFVYLVLMLRHVYHQKWSKTLVKSVLLTSVYSFSLGIVLLIGLIMSFIN